MSENTDNQGNKPNDPPNTDPESFFQHSHPDIEESLEEHDELIPGSTPASQHPGGAGVLPASQHPGGAGVSPASQHPGGAGVSPASQHPGGAGVSPASQHPGGAGVLPASPTAASGFETDQNDWMPHSSEYAPAINFNVGMSEKEHSTNPGQPQPATATPATNIQPSSPGSISVSGQSGFDSFSSSSTQNPALPVNVSPAAPTQVPQAVPQEPQSKPQSFFEAANQPPNQNVASRPQDAITQFFGDEKPAAPKHISQEAPSNPYQVQAPHQAPAPQPNPQPPQQPVNPNIEKLVQQPIFKNPGGVGDRPPLTAKPILPPRSHKQTVVQETTVDPNLSDEIDEETEAPDLEPEDDERDSEKSKRVSKRRVNLDKFEEVVKNPDFQALTQLLFLQAKEIVLKPQEFFSKPIEKGDITEPTIFLAACAAIGGLVAGFANINLFVTFRFVFIAMLFTFVASFMATKLFTNYGSTKTFGENFRVMAYSQVSLLITSIQLGFLSYVTGLLAMVYALYLQKLGMEQLHPEIPKTKLLAILGGVAVFLAIVGNALPGKPY